MTEPPDRGGFTPHITFDKNKSLTILTPGEKFLIMERTDSSDTLANVSPFLIKKVIDNVAGGEMKQCKKLLNGTILIQTKNFIQANKLIQLSSLSPSIKVNIREHPGLNYAKGVIYSNDLRGISEEEILKELEDQNVTYVNKILKNVNGIMTETGLIIMTFASTNLPSDISIGYEKCRVRTYIPLPLKCKNCLQFGHPAKECKNEKACTNCSSKFHTNEELKENCTNPPSCINCKNSSLEDTKHSTNDKRCPVFLKEKEIQAIATIEKVGKKRAAAIYKQRHAQQCSTLYSTVTKTNNVEKPCTTSEMAPPQPPPVEKIKPRFLKDYSDILSDIDNSTSEMETDQISNSSQTVKGNDPIILPKTASKRLRQKIKEATKKSNRISK